MIRRHGHTRRLASPTPPFGLIALLAMLAMLAALALTPVVQSASAAPRGGDSTPPSTPGPLVVTAATQTSITLTWLPATDDVAVVEYGVLWNTRRLKDVEPVAIPPHDSVLRFTKAGLRCGTSYAVKVLAFDAAQNYSEKASEATVSTAACVDSSAPTTPSGVTQIANTQTTATLAWKPSTDDVGVAGYAISTGGVLAGTTAGTSYTVAGLTCGSWFTAVVQAYDAAGNRSSGAAFTGSTASCADRTAPKAPSGLSQVSATTTSMSISWSASSGAARYGVYVGPSRVTETSATGATVSALACGTTYSIGVDAVDAAGNRSAPTAVQMATAPCPTQPAHRTSKDTTPPTTPAGITVTSASQASVAIRWSSSSDNVGVVGYSISKNGAPAGDTTGTTFLVVSLACGSGVTIDVEARDAAGNRSQPATVAATTAPCVDGGAPTMPGAVTMQNRTETSITFSWALSTDAVGVAGYGIYVDGKLVDTTTQGQYTVSGLACGGIYTIGVDAFDADGNRSASSTTLLATTPCSDVSPPSAPTGLEVSNPTQTSVDVAWLASKDDVGVAGYDLYVDDALVRTTLELTATLEGLECDATVTIGLEAFDAAGNRSDRITAPAATASCDGGQVTGSLFVASNGSDSSSCTKAAPCASLDRAYQLAAPGAVVSIAGGSYPAQTIARDPSKTSSAEVVFAAAGSVTLAGFTAGDSPKTQSGPKHLELRGVKVNGYVVLNWGTEDVTVRDVDASGLDLTSVRDVRILGGDYGPVVNGVSHINACGLSGCYPSEDVLIDSASFHDYTITYAEKHSECLMIWPGRGVTIRNSSFRNCTDFDVLVKPYNTGLVGLPGDIVLENNVFDEPIIGDGCFCSRGGNAIGITQGGGESWGNVRIRYNSSLGGIRVDPAITNVTVKGNVARKDQASSCQSNVSFSYNVWSGTACSSTDRVAGLLTLFFGGFDLRLQAGAAALNAGDPNDYPATDRVGTARPLGGAPDAGAYEIG